jgi:hypothetical protein
MNKSDDQKFLNKIGVEYFEVDLDEFKSESGVNFLNHPTSFRNGFWSLTILRFFALLDCMQKLELSKVLHIELDIKLMPTFPWQALENLQYEISYPQVTDQDGSASILYINRTKGLVEMLAEFSRQMRMSPNSTDMSLLGLYKRMHPSRVGLLPTFPGQTQTVLPWELGCFDAATLGMFLTGTDPRNSRGWIHFQKKQPNHIVDIAQFEDIGFIGKSLIFRSQGQTAPIFNLHIHSKQPALFTDAGIEKAISKIKGKGIKKTKFKLLVFVKMVLGSVRRRLLRIS